MYAVVVVGVLLAGLVLLFAVLTGLGSRRRGTSVPVAVLAGVFFPATWIAWYINDGRP